MEAFDENNCLCNWDQEAALEEEMARMSLQPPPPLDDFDDVSIHTAPENLEFMYPDSTDSELSGNTTFLEKQFNLAKRLKAAQVHDSDTPSPFSQRLGGGMGSKILNI